MYIRVCGMTLILEYPNATNRDFMYVPSTSKKYALKSFWTLPY